MTKWRRGTRRLSDGSVSLYDGHRSYEAAKRAAEKSFADEDTAEVWVQRLTDNEVVFRLEAGLPGACPYCGWPPGQGHAPDSGCPGGTTAEHRVQHRAKRPA